MGYIDKSVVDAINEQIKSEGYSAYFYWSISNWCADRDLDGIADFFRKQGDEEHQHMHKLMKFLLDTNSKPIISNFDKVPNEFKSVYDACEQAMAHEIKVTEAIKKITEIAEKEKEYGARDFLDWFNKEQTEELALFQKIMNRLELLGGNATAMSGKSGIELHLFDEWIKGLS